MMISVTVRMTVVEVVILMIVRVIRMIGMVGMVRVHVIVVVVVVVLWTVPVSVIVHNVHATIRIHHSRSVIVHVCITTRL